MIRSGTIVPALLLTAALAGVCAPPAGAAPAPTLVTLKNGLRVVLAPDPDATAADVAVWYPVSARAEGTGDAGLRHLIERLMFRGSAGTPDGELVARVTGTGGTLNTTLTPDYSSFWESVPGEDLGMVLRLEADRMAGLKTSPAAFAEAQRAALMEARAHGGRPPLARTMNLLSASVFAGEPLGRPMEGDEAAIAKQTLLTVDAWRRAHYRAGDAVLTIVGRFDADALLPRVRQLFEPLPRGLAPVLPPAAAARPGPRRVWQRSDVPARLLLVGWRVPGTSDPDYPAIDLLASLLGLGEDSRFSHALTKSWKAGLMAQCGLDSHQQAAMFWTLLATAPGADSSRAEQLVLDQVGSLARDPLPDAEVARARALLLTGERLRLQTVRARAQALGEAVLAGGDPAAVEQRLARIEKLTPADLQRVAQRIFTDAARSTVWVVPEGGAR